MGAGAAIPLRLLAAQPDLMTPMLQVVHRLITRFLLDQAGLTAEQADSGAVTLIRCPNCGAELKIVAAILEAPQAASLPGRQRAREKGAHQRGDLVAFVLEREVPGVEQVQLGAGQVA